MYYVDFIIYTLAALAAITPVLLLVLCAILIYWLLKHED